MSAFGFKVPVSGQRIPHGWFASLVRFVNSLILSGDGTWTMVNRDESGTQVTLTPSAVAALKRAAGAPLAAGSASQCTVLAYDASGTDIAAGDVVMFDTVRATASAEEIASWGLRPDGDPKNCGWRGILYDGDGGIMTEVSVGVRLDGVETDIPLIVPSTTDAELDTIAKVATGEIAPADIPDTILDQAIEWAEDRIAEGKSPYYDGDPDDEQYRVIDDGRLMDGAVPVVGYTSLSEVPWGIAIDTMTPSQKGRVLVMGVAVVEVDTITAAGRYVRPDASGHLMLADDGFALFVRSLGSRSLILLGGGGESLSASVSGGTASIALSGSTSSVDLVGTGAVTISGTSSGAIEIHASGGTSGSGFPDYSRASVLLEDSVVYPAVGALPTDMWLIGTVGLRKTSSSGFPSYVTLYILSTDGTTVVRSMDLFVDTGTFPSVYQDQNLLFSVCRPITAGYRVKIVKTGSSTFDLSLYYT